MEYTHPNNCGCYKCTEPEYQYTSDGRQYISNNMEHHTFGEPCEECGEPKTEYKDLGRKGRYCCWYCEKRAAGPKQ